VTDSYSLVIKRSAEKELRKLPPGDLRRVIDRLRGLTQTPRPSNCEKLSGETERYRIRQGDYRIVYRIDDGARLVEIVKIGHRREIYR
jgi:mRNA interferase RelE/StbE